MQALKLLCSVGVRQSKELLDAGLYTRQFEAFSTVDGTMTHLNRIDGFARDANTLS